MKQNNKKKNTFVAENACGSHFFCNLHPISEKASIGEMLEWLKRHAWKACIPLKGIGGSNPPLSARAGKAAMKSQLFLFCRATEFTQSRPAE